MKRILAVLLAGGVILGGAISSGCGYGIAGKADLMPKSVHTIFIEPFNTGIPRTDLARLLSADLAREFLSRTRFKVVADRGQADAVLAGAITTFSVGATTADPVTSRSTGAQVSMQLNIYLNERVGSKPLFQRNGYEFRERYEISENAATYFDESGTAVQRVTRDAARSIVSAILENF